METVVPGLHASAPDPVPFGPSLEIRPFLLEREQGNLLVYRAESVKQDADAVNDLGGISRQYLNPPPRGRRGVRLVAETFGAPLHWPRRRRALGVGGLQRRRDLRRAPPPGEDFEVVPTPGHTPEATAYLWDTGEHRCLFTGDTVFFPPVEWRALLLRSPAPPPFDGASDRERYIESLELIRGLDFDLLVPSLATADQPYYEHVERAEAERRIDAILERVRAGEDG